MADTDESQSDGDAAEDFDHLTREVSVLHHTAEELVDAIQLKEPPDYSSTLGEIARDLGSIRERLEQVERHPTLRIAPADYPDAMAHAAGTVMREAAHQLDQARRDTERTTHALVQVIGSARTQDRQRKWLMTTAALALVIGLVGSPFLGRLLPFGLDTRMASMVMGTDRWSAGDALMQAGNTEAWRGLRNEINLVTTNQPALAVCREAAAKTKKEQHCTIVVPVL